MITEDAFLTKLRMFGSLVREKEELEEKVEKLTALVNRLLDHITADMIGDGELYARLRESIVKPMKED